MNLRGLRYRGFLSYTERDDRETIPPDLSTFSENKKPGSVSREPGFVTSSARCFQHSR